MEENKQRKSRKELRGGRNVEKEKQKRTNGREETEQGKSRKEPREPSGGKEKQKRT